MIAIESVILVAILSFIFTNIDDFCILVVFFARVSVHDKMSNKNVILGQFIGFTVLVAVSSIGLVLGTFIPPGYVEFLGFVPFFYGNPEFI